MDKRPKFYPKFWILLIFCALHNVEGEKDFKRNEKLSDSFQVEWTTNFESQKLTFKVIAKTRGYVGFGLSTNGNMKGSDLVLGGVHNNGEIYFADYHAIGQTKPIVDPQQDWDLHAAYQNETHTHLQFSRSFHTCDPAHDLDITNDTVNMIWSIGQTDDFFLHIQRGSKQVNFLDPPHAPTDSFNFWTFKIPSNVPNHKDTEYWCTVHKGPSFSRKTHIIGFEVILDEEVSLEYTHHMIFRRCLAPKNKPNKLKQILEPWLGHPGGDCYTREIVELEGLCTANLYVWAKGGQKMVFPDHVGYPISESGEDEYYVMEFHYDNPKLVQNVQYDTGIRVFYTTQLRPQDAGFLYTAHEVDSAITLPPNRKDWMIAGHCSADCTANKFPEEGVHFFNVLLHSHLSGRTLKLRHFRDGSELPWIATDLNYDFNFQQTRPLRQEINVRRGDHLTLECTYDTTWKKPAGAVIGGLSTKFEMCDAFIFYYPRIPELDVCSSSQFQFKKLFQKFGIQSMSMNDQYNPVVTSPQSLAGMAYVDVLSQRVNWTENLYAEIQNELRYGDHVSFCDNYGPTPIAGQFDDIPTTPRTNYPKINNLYQPKLPQCQPGTHNEQGVSSTSNGGVYEGSKLGLFLGVWILMRHF